MGVWNGWVELLFFGLWIFTFRSLKFGEDCSFCGISGIFLENSASEKYFSDSGKWPFHTPPIPPLSAGRIKHWGVGCFGHPVTAENGTSKRPTKCLWKARHPKHSTALEAVVSCHYYSFFNICISKFRRVTIRGAQPSARLSEEICLSEGSAGGSARALRGLSEGSAGSAGLCGGPRDFPRVFGGSDPMLVTLGNCWTQHLKP